MGDNVIVLMRRSAAHGRKSEEKEYFSHSKYPGGEKFTNNKRS